MSVKPIKKIDYYFAQTGMSLKKWIEKSKDNVGTNVETFKFDKDINDMYEVDLNGNITLLEVHSELQEKMSLLEEKCREEGINIKITESVRSALRQDELYAQGRTVSGNIVTNAKGSDYSSMHQWGIAFDVCINDVNDPYNVEKLKKIGEIGKNIGLEWGGDWEGFVDMPHFQLGGYSIKELKEEYGDPLKFLSTWY